MVKYSREPENPIKAAKARASDLRVHFKVNFPRMHSLLVRACFLSWMDAVSGRSNGNIHEAASKLGWRAGFACRTAAGRCFGLRKCTRDGFPNERM